MPRSFGNETWVSNHNRRYNTDAPCRYLVPARSSRRESGILSIPRWITDDVVLAGVDVEPAESPLNSAVVPTLLPSFLEKLLFQNNEPEHIRTNNTYSCSKSRERE